MPKIRMRFNACGPGVNRQAGQVYNVSDEEAKSYVEGGYAVDLSGKLKAKSNPGIADRTAEKADKDPKKGK